MKLIINERQNDYLIKNLIKENDYTYIIEILLDELNKNYKKNSAVVKGDFDYYNSDVILVKFDNTVTTPKKLLGYLYLKYGNICSKEFIKQVISDWFYNKINNGVLSKNIPLKDENK
jgi:hypothetical protein